MFFNPDRLLSRKYTILFPFTSGNSTYCWISDKTAIAVVMVTPLSFALIFNTVCLVKNARVIRRLQQVCHITAVNFLRIRVYVCFRIDVSWTNNQSIMRVTIKYILVFIYFQGARLTASNRSRTSVTLICIKLTTVMGLTWILGLLANWNQTAFLQYPSTVLNSMQGTCWYWVTFF